MILLGKLREGKDMSHVGRANLQDIIICNLDESKSFNNYMRLPSARKFVKLWHGK